MAVVGLLGGTFNPVHNGHLQLAESALTEGGMDSIMFIPAAQPPHKGDCHIIAVQHRLKMLQLAISGNTHYSICGLELDRTQPSYTIHTLNNLRDRAGTDTVYHFIIGTDAFLEIETWFHWQEVIHTTNFMLAQRSGHAYADVADLLERNGFVFIEADQKIWKHRYRGNIVKFLSGLIDDVSSSDIRKLRSAKKTWKHLVPHSVGLYIENNSLYC
jgi:nicotinate-nucleotide adenylyltransferase